VFSKTPVPVRVPSVEVSCLPGRVLANRHAGTRQASGDAAIVHPVMVVTGIGLEHIKIATGTSDTLPCAH